jgi:putative transposase
MVGPVAKREAVAHLQAAIGLSERRACSIVDADRTMIRYRSCRPPETGLRGRLRELANERRRFGYRRLFVLLRREGEPSGINRIYRLYREEGLTVRKRRSRRRAVGTRTPILVEARPNARWSLDFVHDQFACGRRFRVLNIVDDVTRECLAAIPDTSISGRRVARELTALVARRGKPGMIVSDHGTEFTSNAILAWSKDHEVEWHYIEPGKPMQSKRPAATDSAKASTAACAMNCSTKPCSSASSTRERRSPNGPTTTTARARIRRWATSRLRPMPPNSPQRAIGCATPTSSADRPLLKPRPTA